MQIDGPPLMPAHRNNREVEQAANASDRLRDIPAFPARELERRWGELCSKYLPLTARGSIWRFNRSARLDEPEQGWKLHISATVLTAAAVLEKVVEVLRSSDIQFKAPLSLQEVSKINSGIYYGYTQVGKIITVYPQTSEQAVRVGEQLHHVTRSFSAPVVPFDGRVGSGGCVYYRYGAFRQSGTGLAHVVRDPAGTLVSDVRDSPFPGPHWVTNPFNWTDEQESHVAQSPLTTTYRVFRALTQRGKGGVYQAVDLSVTPPRFCIIKEGRQAGESGFDRRDGFWRIQHEARVIKSLRAAGIPAPAILSSFTLDDNFYLVLEFVEGENLQSYLLKRQRRLTISQALSLGVQVASLLARIHSSGWTWRDCKPGNLIIKQDGSLRAVDFEGTCRNDDPDHTPWGTQGFTPPRWQAAVDSRVFEDLYALGAILHFLLTGRVPQVGDRRLDQLRRKIPAKVRALIPELLSEEPKRQPPANRVAETLLEVLCEGVSGRETLPRLTSAK